MEHYVTLFDSFFLPQGLALHRSMERHCGAYKLWILCVDDRCYDVLEQLQLTNVSLLKLSLLETPELLRVKTTRTKGEYCWTLTPFAPRFVFEADGTVEQVTYLDADLWFRRSPSLIFDDFRKAGKHVLITEHAYSPEYDYSHINGQYCVQFMTFNRQAGERVRQWWQERCLEWCHAWLEDGKFGDQKYLDDWPERFESEVHISSGREWFLAPWNATRFPYSSGVVFHFHGLRLLPGNKVSFGSIYPLPNVLIKNVYDIYLQDLRVALNTLRQVPGFSIATQSISLTCFDRLKGCLSALINKVWIFRRVIVKSL